MLVAAAAACGTACGPWGPQGIIPGGPFSGPAATQSAAEACDDATLLAELETRGEPSWLRYSITLFCLTDAGTMYVPSRNGGTKRWTRNVIANSQVRIRIHGAVHEGKLVRVMEVAPSLAKVFLRKVAGVEVEHARFLLTPPEPGDDRTDLWLFRFEEGAS